MQFFLLDLALAFLTLLGYRALGIALRHRAAALSRHGRVSPRPRTGGMGKAVAPPLKPALPKPVRQEAVVRQRAPHGCQRRSHPHRLINLW